jgi:riboflavin-specific deaminase-like protein
MPDQAKNPTVTLSYAQTLDGRLATRSGSSQWIGGPDSLRLAHELRADHDAIMVGAGTVLADDPRLTVRLVPGRDPLRVVADGALRTPATAAVLRDGAAYGTLIAHRPDADPVRRATLAALGATLLPLPPGPAGGVDLQALLGYLAARGVASLMVEGGARLITSLLRARLVHRMVVCVAPKILGAGLSAVGDLGIEHLADAYSLRDVTVTPLGSDQIIAGNLVYP